MSQPGARLRPVREIEQLINVLTNVTAYRELVERVLVQFRQILAEGGCLLDQRGNDQCYADTQHGEQAADHQQQTGPMFHSFAIQPVHKGVQCHGQKQREKHQ